MIHEVVINYLQNLISTVIVKNSKVFRFCEMFRERCQSETDEPCEIWRNLRAYFMIKKIKND